MTAVHQTVNTLVSTLTSALTGWQVFDGWDGHADLPKRAVLIAYTPVQGQEAISSSIGEDEGGLCDVVETISVKCSAVAWDGNMEFTNKRGEVDAMLTTIEQTFAADQKLGGFAFDTWVAPERRWYETIYPYTDDAPAHANVEIDFEIRVRVHAE